MRPPKYPLEPLAELRERRVDEAVDDFVQAARERGAAERRRQTHERDCRRHAAAAERVRSAEADALTQGGLRAADLAQAAAWEARIAVERAGLASGIDRARAQEVAAQEDEARALEEIAAAKANAQVIANDRARWEEARRKRAEACEEEALAETWRPPRT